MRALIHFMTVAPSTRDQTFLLLDGLRGLAALIIVLFHYKNLQRASFWETAPPAPQAPAFRWLLDPIQTYGANAVPLFWVISGAVMCHVYGHQAKQLRTATYVNRRFARLYPLHLLTLLLIAVMQLWSNMRFGAPQIYQYNDLYHFVLQLFFASYWGLEEGLSFNGPIWSVSCEIAAYALFLVFLKTCPLNRLTTLLALSGVMALHVAVGTPLTYCCLCFFGGVAVYQFLPDREASLTASRIYGLLALCTCLGAFVSPIPQGLKVLAVCASGAACVLFLDCVYKPARAPLVGWLGKMSYSSYLMHTPLMIFFILLAGEFGLQIASVRTNVSLFVYVAVVLVVSHLCYHRFERPAQSFIRALSRPRRDATI